MRIGPLARIALLALAMLVSGPPSVSALIIEYVTPTGQKDAAGDPISASAVVATTGGVLQITLSNTLSSLVPLTNIKDAAQLLSDFGFTLAVRNGNGTTIPFTYSPFTITGTPTITSMQGTERTVFGDKTFTFPDPGATFTTFWGVEKSGSGLRLCDLCPGGDGPRHTIISGADTGAPPLYSAANDSITGSVHDGTDSGTDSPFYIGSVIFNLSVAGLTGAVYADSAFFSFGLVEGSNFTGVCALSCLPDTHHTPEPSTLLLLGAGLVGLAGYGWRKRRASH